MPAPKGLSTTDARPTCDCSERDNPKLPCLHCGRHAKQPPTAPTSPVQTFGKPRLQFIDPRTGKPSTGGKDVPEMNVVYLGKFVGTLRGSGCNYRFTEAWPGKHTYSHFIHYLRTHLLRYFDDKYARLGMEFEKRLEGLLDGTSS